jgi:ATP-dependent Clp protease adaptor protein ClpS
MSESDRQNTATAAPAQKGKRKQKKRESRASTQPRKLPPFSVVLLNDDDHTFEYVIEMLGALFAHPKEKAYQLAKEVDTAGRVILLTTTKEHAEFKREQVHAYGRDLRIDSCAGSMTCIIEPAA